MVEITKWRYLLIVLLMNNILSDAQGANLGLNKAKIVFEKRLSWVKKPVTGVIASQTGSLNISFEFIYRHEDTDSKWMFLNFVLLIDVKKSSEVRQPTAR